MAGDFDRHLEANGLDSDLTRGLWEGAKQRYGSKDSSDVVRLHVDPESRVPVHTVRGDEGTRLRVGALHELADEIALTLHGPQGHLAVQSV